MNYIYFIFGLGGIGYLFAKSNQGRSMLDYNEVLKYKDIVKKHVDAYLSGKVSGSWILAMIAQESAGNPNAVGDNGKAFGLMQIQYPAYLDANVSYSFDEIKTDPDRNIETGVRYLRWVWDFLKNHGVDETSLLQWSIVAYNIGVGNIFDDEKREAGKNYFRLVENHYKKIMVSR